MEGKDTDNESEKLSESNFSNLRKVIVIQIQELKKKTNKQTKTPSRINVKNYTQRHIIKLSKDKDKERLLETVKVTHHTKGFLIRLSEDFIAESL